MNISNIERGNVFRHIDDPDQRFFLKTDEVVPSQR